ncbi:MAG: hypothetical protein HY343_02215, partial [Lentisphaerae bacterium]|nr:hypothetical protein [Lentisphaerota bacterium]
SLRKWPLGRKAADVGRWLLGGLCLAVCLWAASGVQVLAQPPSGLAGQATTNSVLSATARPSADPSSHGQAGTGGTGAVAIAALPDIDALRDPFCPIGILSGGGPKPSDPADTNVPPPAVEEKRPEVPPPAVKSSIQAMGTFTDVKGVKYGIINGKMVPEGGTFKVSHDGRTQRYKLKSIKGKKLEIVPVAE